MISPTVGRVVHYVPNSFDVRCGLNANGSGDVLAAIVTAVWHDRLVNLAVYSPQGAVTGRTSVRLLQDDEQPDEDQPHAKWMPYQVGQAAKTEVLEKQLADVSTVGNAPNTNEA